MSESLVIKLINNSSSDKPICVHLDTVVKNACFDIQTPVFGNQLEKPLHNLNKALLLLSFAVYLYAYGAIVQFRIRYDRWLIALKTHLHKVSLGLK